ncbi:hypothetical protein [Streptomyces sp. NPDC007074]|uniref:hypothetical protein n=1 Tax=Streptomyces sp. NPDC007074 TaxID=3156764 RepID=UPI0033C0D118
MARIGRPRKDPREPEEIMRAAGLEPLVSKAGGALADAEAEGGEQTATANMFASAVGAYENPATAPLTSTTR